MSLSVLDRVWWRLVARWPRLYRNADTSAEATHVHHAFVTVILFGTLGAGVGVWSGHVATGFRWGIVVGLLYYAVREVTQIVDEGTDWRNTWWDHVCDIVIPCWVVLPVLLDSLAILWVLSVLVLALYLWLRPR